MRGMFLKTPMIRMGSTNYMRGDSIELTSNTGLAGVALLSVTMIGPGGGGGGMVRRVLEGNPLPGQNADGEAGSRGQLRSNVVVSIRPDSAGYDHKSGGARAVGTISTAGNITAANGTTGSTATLADMGCSGGLGGEGAWLSYPGVSNWNRVAGNVTNPDGVGNFAGRGGFGGDRDSTSSPYYGSSSGQPSKAWVSILD